MITIKVIEVYFFSFLPLWHSYKNKLQLLLSAVLAFCWNADHMKQLWENSGKKLMVQTSDFRESNDHVY